MSALTKEEGGRARILSFNTNREGVESLNDLIFSLKRFNGGKPTIFCLQECESWPRDPSSDHSIVLHGENSKTAIVIPQAWGTRISGRRDGIFVTSLLLTGTGVMRSTSRTSLAASLSSAKR